MRRRLPGRPPTLHLQMQLLHRLQRQLRVWAQSTTVMFECTTGRKGDDTSEGSKKKKEPVFLGGVELVDLDDCDVPDRRL
jgi:hypothetical protein